MNQTPRPPAAMIILEDEYKLNLASERIERLGMGVGTGSTGAEVMRMTTTKIATLDEEEDEEEERESGSQRRSGTPQ